MAQTLSKGATVKFKKRHIEEYGLTGTVTNIQTVISRPYGARTTLVDITTATGVNLQWPLSWVRSDTVSR